MSLLWALQANMALGYFMEPSETVSTQYWFIFKKKEKKKEKYKPNPVLANMKALAMWMTGNKSTELQCFWKQRSSSSNTQTNIKHRRFNDLQLDIKPKHFWLLVRPFPVFQVNTDNRYLWGLFTQSFTDIQDSSLERIMWSTSLYKGDAYGDEPSLY